MDELDAQPFRYEKRPITARGKPDLATQLGLRDVPGAGMREFDRSTLDQHLSDEIDVKGRLNVKVEAPAGTEVKATGDGMFKNGVTVDRTIDATTGP